MSRLLLGLITLGIGKSAISFSLFHTRPRFSLPKNVFTSSITLKVHGDQERIPLSGRFTSSVKKKICDIKAGDQFSGHVVSIRE